MQLKTVQELMQLVLFLALNLSKLNKILFGIQQTHSLRLYVTVKRKIQFNTHCTVINARKYDECSRDSLVPMHALNCCLALLLLPSLPPLVK